MNNLFKKITSAFLIALVGLLITACTSDDEPEVSQEELPQEETQTQDESEVYVEDVVENLVSIDEIVADISLRFAREGDFYFTDPLVDIPRDHTFTFELTQEAMDAFNDNENIENWGDMVGIYRDSAFTQPIAYSTGGDGENFTYVEISPGRNPIFPLPDVDRGQYFNYIEFSDWGNANQYFMVKYFDLLTGEELETPEVTVFNIATEIVGSPWVKFNITEDGVAGLRWGEVDGADEYAVLLISEPKDGSGIGRWVEVVAFTTETYWNDTDRGPFNDRHNDTFRTASITRNMDVLYEDYREAIATGELTQEEFVAMQYDFEDSNTVDDNLYFAVIAINDEGTSSISNLICRRSVAPQVPVSVAINLNEDGVRPTATGGGMARWDYDISLAPSHAWIIMADGSVSRQLINYDVDDAREGMLLFGTYTELDDDGWPIIDDTLDVPALTVPFTIEKTPFVGFIQITDYNEETFPDSLADLATRQDGLRSRTGDIVRSVDLTPETEELDFEDEPVVALNPDFDIIASSPLSAYLAIQMLNGQKRINLDDFPEAADHEYLVEAWFAAALQNPLILGVRSLQLCWSTGDLLLTYDHDAEEIARQQIAIKERVNEIVAEIIDPNMSALEMQTVINDFLIENATYDFAALENAEQNNFMFVDSQYYDSFTAYGILINGVGVCSGYADAFTLIANQAGLESVIVTGYLLGSLPHAWNRVNIDGQWYTLDVTNNDNEIFPNAFFNLSDVEAATILTEDNRWMLDEQISRFVATSSAYTEFYRYRDQFFDRQSIVDALVEGVLENGEATYRTDIMLTDEQFLLIAFEVMDQTGIDLYGGHFLGIITLFE